MDRREERVRDKDGISGMAGRPSLGVNEERYSPLPAVDSGQEGPTE